MSNMVLHNKPVSKVRHCYQLYYPSSRYLHQVLPITIIVGVTVNTFKTCTNRRRTTFVREKALTLQTWENENRKRETETTSAGKELVRSFVRSFALGRESFGPYKNAAEFHD